MKTAWLGLLACSLVSAFAISACEIKTSDGDGGEGGADEESGGRTSSGGRGSGGSTSGGKTSGGASSGGKTSGGSTSMGGSGGMGGDDTGPMCEGKLGTPAASCDVPTTGLPTAEAACIECLKKTANCCAEIKNCYATSPNNECGYGGPNPLETEYLCYQRCLADGTDEETCASDCTRCTNISTETNELIICMADKCAAECLP